MHSQNKKITAIFLCIITCILSTVYCAGAGQAETEITGSAKAELLKNIQLHKINEEVMTAEIETFDINEKGEIMVLMTDSTINIYNDKGEYLYGYAFDAAGGLDICYWSGDKLCIYIVRGGVKAVIDGDKISLYNVENISDLQDYDERGNVQEHSGLTYTMESSTDSAFSGGYDSIKITEDGKFVKTLIDVSQTKALVGKEYVKKDYGSMGYAFFIFITAGIISVFLKIGKSSQKDGDK
ncbi:MAG: hypothetical protein IJR59_06515 [Firmicutes bacterium]|nr:hypothetical protein [Bacillota bacterium]